MALKDTPICDFGWKAPDFTLKTPQGNSFSLSESLGEKGLLVAFLCNHCPYVKAITARFAEDTNELIANCINVLGVMSNDYRSYPADAPDKMETFAAAAGWSFPYLVDEDQSVGKAFGAVCTPDFFGFNAKGELQYRGRLDDARMNDDPDRTRELVHAMLQIAQSGKGPKDQTPSMGCSIKWA